MGDLEIEVIVREASFRDEAHHFVALQLNQDPKVRTEVTSAIRTPKFTGSSFTFLLEGALDQDRVIEDVLYFALFEVTLKKGPGGRAGDDTARYIGGGCLSLCEITDQVVTDGSAEVTVVLSRLPKREGWEGVDVGELYLEVLERAVHPTEGMASSLDAGSVAPVERRRGGGGDDDGSVRVQVVEAHELPSKDSEKSHTYVEVWLSEEHTSSQVNSSGGSPPSSTGSNDVLIGRTREVPLPSWYETLETALPPTASWRDYNTLIFRVFSKGLGAPTMMISQRVIPVAPMRASPGPHLLALECEPTGLLLTTVDLRSGSRLPGPGAMALSGHELQWPQDGVPPSAQAFACLQLMRAEEAEALATTSLASEEVFSLPFGHWPVQQQGPPPLCGGSRALLTNGQMKDGKLCWQDQARVVLPAAEGEGESWACVLRCLYDTYTFKMASSTDGGICESLFESFAYAILPMPALSKAASQPTTAETLFVLRLPASQSTSSPRDMPLPRGGQLLSAPYRAVCSGVINKAWVEGKRRKRPVGPPPSESVQAAGAAEGAEMESLSTWERVDISQLRPEEVEKERPLTAELGISPLERKLLALTDELCDKDSAIEKLEHELDQQAEAIRKCGTEILKLRQEKLEVEAVRDDMRRRIQDAERESERATSLVVCEDGEKIKHSSLPELQRVLPILIKRYHGVRLEKDKLARRVHSMAQELQDYAVLKAAFAKLQRAHLGQSAYIQTLQGKQTRVESYKTTIRMQEKVIQRLEELLESKLQQSHSQEATPRSSASADPTTPRGFARGAAVDALKEEISRLRTENEALRQEAVEAHELAAAAKEARIKAVEEELLEQARASAKEITELRMRIFEMEYGVDSLTRPVESAAPGVGVSAKKLGGEDLRRGSGGGDAAANMMTQAHYPWGAPAASSTGPLNSTSAII